MSNPVGTLQEFAQAKRGSFPIYQTVEATGASHCPQFTIEVKLGEVSAQGTGKSKKSAKHEAAKNLLAKLDGKEEVKSDTNVEEESRPVNTKEGNEDSLSKDGASQEVKVYSGNTVGELQEYTIQRGFGQPTYEEGETTGPAHMRHFVIYCGLGDIKVKGEGNNKKEAKRQAAGALLDKISNKGGASEEIEKYKRNTEENVEGKVEKETDFVSAEDIISETLNKDILEDHSEEISQEDAEC